MPIVAVINQKGGCGKTTTAVNLSAALVANRKKILLVDMDPQGHAAISFGMNPDAMPTVFDVLDYDTDKQFNDVIQELSSGFDLAPANIYLSVLEQKLAGKRGRENRLQYKLAKLKKNYDYIIIDCPPNLGLLTINALICSERLIVPVDPSVFSLHGIEKLHETITMLNNKRGHRPELYGIATIFDRRTNFAKSFRSRLEEVFGKSLFQTIIPASVKFREAAEAGTSLINYAPSCKGAQAYLGLAGEVLKQDGHKILQKSRRSKKTARKITTVKKTTFVFPHINDAKRVQVAGEFNDWDPAAGVLKRENGHWCADFSLKPGRYQYKYIVDGEWLLDPTNNRHVETELGNLNSVIMVS